MEVQQKTVIRPAPAIDAIPATTPFVGPEQLMRETGQSELVRLGANESAFGPSPKAVEAMNAQQALIAWYGDPESLDLRDALAAKHECKPSQILVGAGIDDIMGLAVRGFVAPGDAALTTRGSYPTFNYHVIGYGGRLVYAQYKESGELDLEMVLDVARKEQPKVLYLANPDNPSGTFVERAQMISFFEALPRDVIFFLDEAYADFVEAGEVLPAQIEDRLVRTRTFSKAYGMAGARIGYAITSEAIIATMQKIRLHYGVNRNAQIGALASLSDEAYRRHVVSETAAAREDYYRLASDLGLGAIPSRTNFVCIDLGSTERATRVMNELLRRGVWIRKPGLPPLDRFVRVSAGTAPMRAAFATAFRAVLDEVRA
jgi:histidinol-phosphate aminotransferase